MKEGSEEQDRERGKKGEQFHPRRKKGKRKKGKRETQKG